MRGLFIIVALSLVALTAFGQSYNVQRRDQKLATQQMIEKQEVDNAVAPVANRILNDQTTSASTTTTVTSFAAQPDVARNLNITPVGTTADVAAGDIIVTGTNILGETISETISIDANQSTVEIGTKAFKTVTSILFPVQDGAGAMFDVGVSGALGLKHCMNDNGHFFHATFNGAKESSVTLTSDADEVEKNTATIASSLNGTGDVDFFFMQNYQCTN